MGSALRALLVLAVLATTGAPVALALSPRRRPHLVGFAFEAVALGLLAQLCIAFVAVRTGHFSASAFLVATIVLALVAVTVAVRRGRVVLPSPAPGWLTVAAVPLGVLALVARTHPAYFLFETGDMGEYVNLANRVARGSNLVQSFPHGFTLFLAASNVLLGQRHTVGGLPALGLAFLLGLLAIAATLRLGRVAVLLVGLVVALHPVTVWFSTFPVSETVYSVLLVATLYFLIRARAARWHPYAVVAGLFTGMMLLTRGNAMLVPPLVVLAYLASALTDDDVVHRVQRTFSISSLLALAVAYTYDVRLLDKYFVRDQLHHLTPAVVLKAARRLHLLEASAALVVAVALGIAAVLAAGWLFRHRLSSWAVPRSRAVWTATYAAIVLVTLVTLAAMAHGGLVDSLARWGPVVAVPAGVGLALTIVVPSERIDPVIALFVTAGIGAYAVLFAHRVPHARSLAYYLYDDRYLFSEVLPLAFVLFAVGVHWMVRALQRVVPVRRTRVAALAVAATVALLLVPEVLETRRITRLTLFDDAYGAMHRIDALARTNGVRPIVYSGAAAMPEGWFYPNTYRAFAVPLNETFGRRIVGTAFDPKHADPRFDPVRAHAVLARAGYRHGYLVALRDPGRSPYPDDAGTRRLGSVEYRVPVLPRDTDRSKEHFRFVNFTFDVYALE